MQSDTVSALGRAESNIVRVSPISPLSVINCFKYCESHISIKRLGDESVTRKTHATHYSHAAAAAAGLWQEARTGRP